MAVVRHTLALTDGQPDLLPLAISRNQDQLYEIATGLDLTGAAVEWIVKTADAAPDSAHLAVLDNGTVGGITVQSPPSAGIIALTIPVGLFSSKTAFIAGRAPALTQAAKTWLGNGTQRNLWEGPLAVTDFGVGSTTAPVLVAPPPPPAPPTAALGYFAARMPPYTVPQGDSAFTYNAVTGEPALLMHFFQDAVKGSEPTAFPADMFGVPRMDEVRANGASGVLPVISLELCDSTVVPKQNQPAWSNAQILAGTHDAFLTTWCTQAAAWNHPLIVVPMWEMTGRWYPWAAGANGNTPISCAAAFNYVARFIKTRVPLALVCWCPSVEIPTSLLVPLENCWPGSANVDILGMNGYNKGPANSDQLGQYLSPESIFRATYTRLCALAAEPPVLIVETGCVPGATTADKGTWTGQFGDMLLAMPRVKGACFFSRLFGSLDYRVDGTPSDLTAWRALAARPQLQVPFPTS